MASHDQSFRAGEAKGRTEEKRNQMTDSMKQTAQGAKDKTQDTTEAAKGETEEMVHDGKEKTGGLLHKTGEKMKNIAEAVKQSFGMASSGDDGDPREPHVVDSADEQRKNTTGPKGY